MKETCEIVQDLLPLYVDNACTGASRQMVSRHLAECPDCSLLLAKLQNHTVDQALGQERDEVISRQRAFFKRKSAVAGLVISAIFMVPILACLIVNLAAGRTLDWFFIVLASLLLAASLTVVPLMAPKDKGLWTLGLGTGSLLLLLAVTCIYSHGNWFAVAASGTLFGLAVIFLPFVLRSAPLRGYAGDRKGLWYMGTVTLLLVIMMVTIGFYSRSPQYPATAAMIAIPVIFMSWFLFGVIRYLKAGVLARTGICLITVAVFVFLADTVFPALAGEGWEWPALRLNVWNEMTVDANVRWVILFAGCAAGAALIFVDRIRNRS